MNLIYICVFYQKKYINLLKLLINSISLKSNINTETTDIVIMTSKIFKPIIEKELKNFNLSLYYYILEIDTIFESACSRLCIFNYENINKYDKILYLDTDIIINSDINVLFNLDISPDKIYVVEEGTIGHIYFGEYWGKQFFDFTLYDKNTSAFSSCVLFFKNSNSIKSLFESIQTHILNYIYKYNNNIPVCLDQPFIVYNTIIQNKYNNSLLNNYIENNSKNILLSVIKPEKIIYHFSGCIGNYEYKKKMIDIFFEKINGPNMSFVTILNNKKYSWQDNYIIFLENGLMNAFGRGIYIQKEPYKFYAFFKDIIYSLVFNNEYTEFVATTNDNDSIIKGKLLT